MKKIIGVLILSLIMLVPATVFFITANAFDARDGKCDTYVYAPGVYDLSVECDDPDATFQWGASIGYHGSFMELIDNDKYSGTKTSHMSLITNDSLASADSDWDEIVFWCKVTSHGVTRYLVGQKMGIATHGMLLRDIEKKGIAITDLGISSGEYASKKTVNDITYFDCFAGQPFCPIYSWYKGDANIFFQSEVSFKTEMHIIEDGKDTVLDEYDDYTPRKTGKGIITMRLDLVLYQNGERMETVDSRSAVVNVITPDGVGKAYTKQACSVLEEQYSQSKVLAHLDKGEYITLLEQKGGYWKVVGGGRAGYVPATALNVLENIGDVSVSIPEPVANTAMTAEVDLGDSSLYGLFDQEPVTWYDKTASRFLNANDKFISGHTYELSVWLKAKNGKRFEISDGSPAVIAYINGVRVTAKKAYEQDPQEVVELTLTYDHVHSFHYIAKVEPTCTQEGKLGRYKCSCGWSFEDAKAKTRIEDINWGVIPALGHRESEWKSDGTNHYKVCLRSGCGSIIPGSSETHSGGTAACMHGAICEVCSLEYGAPGPHNYASEWNYIDDDGHAHYCTNLCGEHSAIVSHRPGPAATADTPQVCLDCGYVLAAPVSHTHVLELVEIVNPTCTLPGKAAYFRCSCGSCFEDSSGLIPITSSDWGIIPPLGHIDSDWQFDDNYHYKVCLRSECGQTISGTFEEHAGGSATCTEQAHCDVCGEPYGYFAPHTWSDVFTCYDENFHVHVCTAEGCNAESEPLPHRPGAPATATDPQVCLDCGFVIEEALGGDNPTQPPETDDPFGTAEPSPTPSNTAEPPETSEPSLTPEPSENTPEQGTSEPSGSPEEKPSGALIAAAVAATVLLIAAAAVLAVVIVKKRKK